MVMVTMLVIMGSRDNKSIVIIKHLLVSYAGDLYISLERAPFNTTSRQFHCLSDISFICKEHLFGYNESICLEMKISLVPSKGSSISEIALESLMVCVFM